MSPLAVSITIGMPDSARISRQISMPSLPGSMRSSSTRSGLNSRNAATACSPSATEMRLETLTAQHDAQHLGQGGVVIDDQDASLHEVMVPPTVAI